MNPMLHDIQTMLHSLKLEQIDLHAFSVEEQSPLAAVHAFLLEQIIHG